MMRRALLASVFLGALALLPAAARAQVESREGITLQNQILQLRQEMEQMRARGGGGGGYAAPALPPPSRGGGGGGTSGELIAPLLDRVNSLEDEVRRLRGRADEAEFRNKALQQQVEKLQGDMDYRLTQLEQGGGGAGNGGAGGGAPAARPAPAPAAPAPAAGNLAAPAAAAPARPAAPAPAANTQEAKLQQGDDLLSKRDYQNAALAYDDAYRRNRQSARAPEALIGLASAFNGFGAKREACQTLDQLNSEFPRLPALLSQRAAGVRQRAGCR
ncbi:YbgF trimerization domain-containing protein [Roseomonas elaeocarpi]|uniref:YbgF trimerization domain-containing protein n=1 Tax=Roseomonas elaeocarpi TaxID=907779 RepID=A0ABV6JQU6_9PROT